MTPTLPSEGFIKLDEVLKHLPIKKTQWYQGIRDGVFPESYPVPNSRRAVCWDVDDIRRVIEEIKLQKVDSVTIH
jgi:predicted DNA-binding transcriptional regulator AlpA